MKATLDIPRSEINALLKEVRAWQVRTRDDVSGLIESTADKMVASAKSMAPVDEGDFQKGITKRFNKEAYELYALIIGRAPHSNLIELGTSKMTAQPTIIRAFEMHIGDFVRDLKALIR